MSSRDVLTAALIQLGKNDKQAMECLLPLVYDELRALAHHQRFSWRDNRAPSTGSLVHEAYLKLVDQTQVVWESRAQFFYIASRAMRSILIDNARHFARQKRGGGDEPVPLDEVVLVSADQTDTLLALDEALDRLSAADDGLARIVECRFFGGLTVEETAGALGLSPATVKRRWSLARAWLHQELNGA